MVSSNDTSVAIIYVTYPDKESAEQSSSLLLKERLIACANINHPHTACFMWNGVSKQSQEVSSILKTSPSHIDVVISSIERHHPYDCPCILITIAQSSPSFAAWVRTSLS